MCSGGSARTGDRAKAKGNAANRNPFVIPISRMGVGEAMPAGALRGFSPLTPSAHRRCLMA